MKRHLNGVPRREYRFPREDGVWLHVTEWGRHGPGVTVVLTHGWSLSGQSWEDVAEQLVTIDPTLRVIAYDHRGHGQSARASASLEVLADDLAALVTELVPTGALVLGGHSMGGMTLMALVERHPRIVAERTAGVALVSTSAGDLPARLRGLPGFRWVAALMLAVTSRRKLPRRPLVLLRQGTRLGLFGVHPRRHDMNRAVLQAAQSHPPTVADLGRSMLQHDRQAALAAFDGIDTVVMVGTRDTLTPPAHAQAIHAGVPGSRLVVYPESGHYLPYEQREDVALQLLRLAAKASAIPLHWSEAVG